jgi:hypothetical protein
MDDDRRGERSTMKVTIEIDGEKHAVELSDETADALKEIAERNGQTLETALQQAIVNENRIEDAIGPDGKLLLEKGGQFRELFYEPA